MSYLHMFRRKPAITSSDWHFTAFQNSSENYATFNRSIHYNLVLERSTGFHGDQNLSCNLIYFSLPLFIPDFIVLIKLNPSCVRCALLFISLATVHQSKKSFFFTPTKGYDSKKGIILSVTVVNLVITNVTAGCLVCFSTEPDPKDFCITSINLESLSCCGIINFNIKCSLTVDKSCNPIRIRYYFSLD